MQLTAPPKASKRLCLACGLAHLRGKCEGQRASKGKIRWAVIEGPDGRVRVKVHTTTVGARRYYLRHHQVRRAIHLVGSIRRVLLGTQRAFLLDAEAPGGVWLQVDHVEPVTPEAKPAAAVTADQASLLVDP